MFRKLKRFASFLCDEFNYLAAALAFNVSICRAEDSMMGESRYQCELWFPWYTSRTLSHTISLSLSFLCVTYAHYLFPPLYLYPSLLISFSLYLCLLSIPFSIILLISFALSHFIFFLSQFTFLFFCHFIYLTHNLSPLQSLSFSLLPFKSFCFLKMGHPRPLLSFIFGLFKQTLHPVSGTRIRTHDLLDVSLLL